MLLLQKLFKQFQPLQPGTDKAKLLGLISLKYKEGRRAKSLLLFPKHPYV